MPALPSVSKVVRIDFHMTFSGDTNAQVRVFFSYGGALSAADAATWVGAIAAQWIAQILPLLHNSVTLNSTVLTDLSSNTAPQAVSTTTGTGGVTTTGTPADAAAIVKLKIARRYRGGHPRKYIPGVPASAIGVTLQQLSATFQANLAANYGTFVTNSVAAVPVAAAPATEVNVSYFAGFTNHTFPSGRIRPIPTPRAVPVVDSVLSRSVNPRIGTQRRRVQQSP